MAFWSRNKGGPTQPFEHPELGPVRWVHGEWHVDEPAILTGESHSMAVLAGTRAAPDTGAVDCYLRMRDRFPELLAQLREEFFELHESYTDSDPASRLESPEQLWSSVESLSVFVGGAGAFDLKLHFEWQSEDDGLNVCARFVDWRCKSVAIE